jgi:hypothetical protein
MLSKVSLAAILAIIAALACAAPAHAQPTTLWVSGTGNDNNPCSRTAPCRTFEGAINRSTANGRISCLDPGEFGVVNLSISLTIDCTGARGSVAANATSFAITVGGGGINVVLRGLDVQGDGFSLAGIGFSSTGGSLTIEDTLVQRFNGQNFTCCSAGILVQPTGGQAATVMLNNVTVINNGQPTTGGGLIVLPGAGATAVVILRNSEIANNTSGILVNSAAGNGGGGPIAMTISNSTIAHNRGDGINAAAGSGIVLTVEGTTLSANFQTGITASGANALVRLSNSVIAGNARGVSGNIRSLKNNAIKGNGTDGTPLPQDALN